MSYEARSLEALARLKGELGTMPTAHHSAREELALVERVLAGRRQLAITAARLAPPEYIRRELGERPVDPNRRRSWERGVGLIEAYRQEHGVRDPGHALGTEPKGGVERARREAQLRQLRQVQRELGREAGPARERELGIGR